MPNWQVFCEKRNGMHFFLFLSYTQSIWEQKENLQPYWPWRSNDTFSSLKKAKESLPYVQQKKAVKNRLLSSLQIQRENECFLHADLSVWKFVPNWPHVSVFFYFRRKKITEFEIIPWNERDFPFNFHAKIESFSSLISFELRDQFWNFSSTVKPLHFRPF